MQKQLSNLGIRRPGHQEQILVKSVVSWSERIIVGVYHFYDEDNEDKFLTVNLIENRTLSDQYGLGYLTIKSALDSTQELFDKEYAI